MKRSTMVLYLVVVVILSSMVVWRIGWSTPAAAQQSDRESRSRRAMEIRAKEAAEAEAKKQAKEAEIKDTGVESGDFATSDERNQAAAAREGAEAGEGDDAKEADETGDAGEENGSRQEDKTKDEKGEEDKADEDEDDGLEAVNFKDMDMNQLIPTIASWTGKVIIPHQDVLGQKLTIYSAKKLPQEDALARIYDALRAKGFIIEQTDGVIFIKPIKDAKLGNVPMVTASQPLAMIENRNQIVQKFFRLNNYSPGQMQQIILPLIPEHGYISSDETTRQLVVIDTVSSLMRIEKIIQQLDVPEAEETVTKIFEITAEDPSEIVQLLRLLLGEDGGRSARRRNQPGRRESNEGSPATSVVIGPSDSPIVLIPMLQRKWIIAKASSDDMLKIEKWIKELDRQKPQEREYVVRKIEYVKDIDDLARQINETIQRMPGSEIRANVMVQPLETARQLLIVGSEENRKLVEKLIDEVDIPIGNLLTEDFQVKYADPEKIAEYIEELYTEQQSSRSRYSYYYYDRRDNDQDVVRAIAYPALKKVTVIASPEKMSDIRKQIEEWDKPINVDEVTPLIIELENSDPLKMTDLLSRLFSEDQSGADDFYRYIFGGDDGEKKKIVGPLYGQLTFEAVPDTNKIIVISKIPEAYEVIRNLVEKLDREESAELPIVVTLKYADSEELCDQLNATLNEPGTRATVIRRETGLTSFITGGDDAEAQGGARNTNQQSNMQELEPWWNSSQAGRSIRGEQEKPISNIIGKIRFIPVHRSKALLVLAPREYQDHVRQLIEQLDQPAKQVIVKAVIMEVNHSDLSSLGVRVASDPGSLGLFNENAVAALTRLIYEENLSSTLTLQGDMNVTVLVDALVKYSNGKVMNEPTLRMKDNEEAKFFDGREVPIVEGEIDSEEGTRTVRQVTYESVGVKLQVRPNITPENAVDLTIKLEISQVDEERIDGNISIGNFNTDTHLIVENGETILISGIIFQNDSQVERRVPILGDIPGIGELFKQKEKVKTNSELLAFITPYVIDGRNTGDMAREQLERSRKRLTELMSEFARSFEMVE